MLNHFNKTLLLLGTVSLFSLPAFAQEPAAASDHEFTVGGKIRAYFGQYSSGVDGETAHLKSVSEANLQAKVKRGDISAMYEIETRTNKDSPTTMRQVTYTQGALAVTIGTCKPKASYSFSESAGTKTSATSAVFYKGQTIKTENDGLCASYKAADAIKVGVTLYERDALNKDKTSLTGNASGSATQYSAEGKIGDLAYRLSGISSKTDQFDGSDTLSHSGSHLGVQYKISDFKVSLDTAGKIIEKAATYTVDANGDPTTTVDQAAHKTTTTDNALQLAYKLGNKQQIILTGASVSDLDDTEGAKATVSTYSNLAYVIPISKGADILVISGTKAKQKGDATAVTASYSAVGFFTKF